MPHELEYIVDQAVCHCDKGAAPAFFTGKANQNVKINGCMACTKADKIPITNIPAFGVCAVSGSACMPKPVEWTDTYKVKVKGQETLLFKSKLPCSVGGKVEFMTSGQVPVSPEELQDMVDENSEEQEDEGWGWWDTAELIPVVGSIIGIVRETAKGNGWMALANVGFLAMDVAGLVSFGATTAASTALKSGAKVGIKAAAKASLEAAGKVLTKTGAKAVAKGIAKHVDDIAKATLKVCVFACFPAGTIVQTAGGTKVIEDITVGDEVWSYNEDTGAIALKTVTAIMQHEVDATVEIGLEGETIETTAEHPFFTQEGWKAAADLERDEQLRNKDGTWMPVKEHKFLYQQRKVFNFEVEGWHTYFVGALAWLVHNAQVCLTAAAKAGEKWAIDILRGIAFNSTANKAFLELAEKNGLKYFSETWLKQGGKLVARVDGYIPKMAIIERKATDLSKVTAETAKGYINQLATKYKGGMEIANKTKGDMLSGQKFLQVNKIGDVSQEVLDYANKKGVTIVENVEDVFTHIGF